MQVIIKDTIILESNSSTNLKDIVLEYKNNLDLLPALLCFAIRKLWI